MRKASIVIVFLFVVSAVTAQQTVRRVLFLGNSYTYVNDLPGLIAQLAHSAGDSLYHDQNTPGGYTLGWNPIAHSTDPVSLEKIAQGGWDFVIIQEQSQTPASPARRDSCMYPASFILHDSVKSADPCTRVLFFQTWGRRFGGEQCFATNYCSTNFADFGQMQDSLSSAYKGIADLLRAWIAPAGEAWRMSLQLHPNQILHMSDDSHPNLKGSYLAACVFFDVIFGKRSYGLSFLGGLADTAHTFQRVADSIVFGDPSFWNIGILDPKAVFKTTVSGDTLYTDNQSVNSHTWLWDFGDGNTSLEFEPVHNYVSPGHYFVTLTACDSCRCDTAILEVDILPTGFTGPQTNLTNVFLSSPDPDGFVRLPGFESEGVLTFYDLTGRRSGVFYVTKGMVNISGLSSGFYLWKLLLNPHNRVVSGKFIR